MAFREKLVRRAKKVGLSIPPEVISGLEAYFGLLTTWNRRVSLTSFLLDEPADEAVDRLLIEPRLASKHLPSRTMAVIDVGTGGGSPAIPLKLARPDIAMRMVESKARKAAFLRDVVRQLGLERAEVETARFEELLARPELHETTDVVTLRAVRIQQKTLMGLQAFLRPGGSLFLFRSGPMIALDADLTTAPLYWRRSCPLVPSLGSRLEILEKSERL